MQKTETSRALSEATGSAGQQARSHDALWNLYAHLMGQKKVLLWVATDGCFVMELGDCRAKPYRARKLDDLLMRQNLEQEPNQ